MVKGAVALSKVSPLEGHLQLELIGELTEVVRWKVLRPWDTKSSGPGLTTWMIRAGGGGIDARGGRGTDPGAAQSDRNGAKILLQPVGSRFAGKFSSPVVLGQCEVAAFGHQNSPPLGDVVELSAI